MDEDDFWKACDQQQLLVIERYLSTGGDVDACDAVSRRHSAESSFIVLTDSGSLEPVGTCRTDEGTNIKIHQILAWRLGSRWEQFFSPWWFHVVFILVQC